MADTASIPPKVVIVGAGWTGIAAAKTYLEVNPSISLTTIDSGRSVGGSWSVERIYPGLVAESVSGMFDYSDVPLDENLPAWSPLTGDKVCQYLQRYAHDKGVLERCMLNTRVLEVKRAGAGWEVWIEPTNAKEQGSNRRVIACDKLIVAAGLTSIPAIPDVDTSKFDGPVLHSREMGASHHLLSGNNVKEITVVGGNKSALEAVKYFSGIGKRVTWLIREDGNGAGIILNSRTPQGEPVLKFVYARFTSIFRIGAYQTKGLWYQLLASGRSKLGLWLMMNFWKSRTKPLLKRAFWNTAGVAMLQDDDADFMRTVNEGRLINVVRAGVQCASGGNVYLTNGETINSHGIVFATGWRPGHLVLFKPEEFAELGLPLPKVDVPQDVTTYWRDLDAEADKDVLRTFPLLKDPPPFAEKKEMSSTPFRLFRAMVPPTLAARHDRSIVFMGALLNVQVPVYAQVSALWAVAYLEDKLPDGACGGILGDKLKMDTDIAMANAFMARRYPRTDLKPTGSIEIQDWIDLMLKDLGLRSDRKIKQSGWNWFGLKGFYREWFEPYVVADYRGIVQEARANWRNI